MAAAPDFMTRLLSGGDPNAPGLLGLINKGTAPFGGATNLGLSLLANSGYSNTPRTFGSLLGQSALNAQQMQAAQQEAQLKQQYLQAQLAALQAKPAANPVVVNGKLVDPTSGRVIYSGGANYGALDPSKYTPESMAAFEKGGGTDYSLLKKAEEDKPMDELAKLTADFKAGRISEADYKARRELMTTRAPNQAAITATGFNDPKIQALQAAFTTAGVSPPSGFRSQAQQLSMFQGLLARNPDKTPDEIVSQIRTGQLDFNGAKRSTAQIATAAAVTDAAARQLEKNFAAMEPLVAKMGATGIPTMDRAFAQLRQNWSSGGDKDTAAFLTYLRAVAGEYAKIKSGGIGAAAPAEGEMKDALSVMQNAFSIGGYEGIKEALLTEAENKRASYQEGLQGAAARSTAATPAAVPSTNSKGWVLHTDKNGNRAYVSPDGKSYEEVK